MFSFSCDSEEQAERWISHLLKVLKSIQVSFAHTNADGNLNQADELCIERLLQIKDNYIQTHPDSPHSHSDIVPFRLGV